MKNISKYKKKQPMRTKRRKLYLNLKIELLGTNMVFVLEG